MSENALAAPLVLHLADDDATRQLGEDMVLLLRQGDVVALSGDLGAGKSTLARAMIQAHANAPGLDVPSPTYTLVQTYDTAPPIAHFDLYRLSEESELDELGFDEAAEAGIVLCEWPERAPAVFLASSLRVGLSIDGEGRRAEISGTPQALSRLRRTLAIRAFLDADTQPVCQRRRFFGDASPRRYESVLRGGAPALLMDAPRQTQGLPVEGGLPYARIAHIAEDVAPFVAVARALRAEGFAAPEVFAADLDQGFVLIEHLGEGTVLDAAGRPIPERYEAAALMLAELHARGWDAVLPVAGDTVHAVPDFDRRAMAIEVGLLLDWYFPRMRGAKATDAERSEYVAVWGDLFDTLREAETSLVLRDLHSPNIVWREDRAGLDRIGLVDFQDAMIGPAAYDLASLAQDARVDVAPELEMRLVAAYAAARRAQGSFDAYAFERDYAIMAAQRASKILGIFVRLDERDGKPQYLRHIPRLKDYLARTLDHPALAALKTLYSRWGLIGDAPGAR
ncbi:bifunctional tRNA (adenosine(37)-N6)-threonylcarbamoyltransferase complex ATPase subunit type 1 TsaE/phosphotransferase [Aureimonas sp. SA4125]|uniref:tRNA (adenosine(37)-N6)-threonylcarbamoyltransferase complex ATPase subunit type 1 TsaE n=1 Tax=Aureimonas sp. SA4125 TaxID=2826993 RepID=UPI001CC7C31B|nr:tRNA (adenosine(37)-N6)-threonylcarbamoyltransferase complex ATPase subunit type 1 TsaE [Aureimonas sp. SA4125]BDA87027.1 bifunctional tRNA (adenosine(37)-N6)-threonylcarbamoyltransferase complex ATPase subunit type 1 TsaE/phosphotransferase [Aureimonas sp. SA4125]